jgi:hypothetical protein
MKKIMIAALLILLTACSDGDAAMHALRGAGYTNVEITGFKFFGCGKDDTFTTGFDAKGPTGEHVSGVVCSGFGLFSKGATIRIF